MVPTKKCSNCGVKKPLDDFRKGRVCRECENRSSREAAGKRRAAQKKQASETKECRHSEHQGQRILPISQFGKDTDKSDGLRSYCKACVNKTQNQNRRKREILNELRYRISFNQGDDCYACRGPLRKGYSVDVFYASLIAAWVQYWRGERKQPRASYSPQALVGTVAHRTLTDEVEWFMSEPKSEAVKEELRLRIKDQRLICGRCWARWHEAGGADLKRMKWKKKPYEFPEVVLTSEEVEEWSELESLERKQRQEADEIERERRKM